MDRELRDKIITKVVGGLVIVTLAVILATLQIKLFPNTDWSEIDTTPLYWPETFPPDPEPLHADTVIYEDDNIIYWEWDSQSSYQDSIKDDNNDCLKLNPLLTEEEILEWHRQ